MAYWDGTRWHDDVPATNAARPRRGRRLLGAAAEAALITTLVFGLIATSAFAAKGGNTSHQGGQGGGGKVAASLVVAPDPVDAYGVNYVVTGSGFKASTPVNIVLSMPSCCAFFTVSADASGDVYFTYTTGAPGTYEVDAYQRLNGKKLTLVGSSTFSVVAP